MGRRATHTADELRSLVIDAAGVIIVERGFDGLSAREIARRIDYSPGTLYNVFDNLNDLVLAVEGRVLDRLVEALDEIPAAGTPSERLKLLARRYVQFASENKQLWSLLFAHRLPEDRKAPDWYHEKVTAVVERLSSVGPPTRTDGDGDPLRWGKTLWVALHGMTGVAMETKAASIVGDEFDEIFGEFVDTYVEGLVTRSQI